MRDLVAFHWKILVSTVGNNFKHASIKLLNDLNCLLPIMNCSNFSIDVLFFNLCFVLLESDVWQLNRMCRMMFSWQLVPDEGEGVFT